MLFGRAAGGFAPVVKVPLASRPHEIRATDLNGDAKPDLVTANDLGDNVSVAIGKGDGTFQAPVLYPVGNAPMSLVAGNFNGDGKRAVGVGVLLGHGDGTFGSVRSYAAGSHPFSIAAGDFNSDGRLDAVTANFNTGANNISFHRNITPAPDTTPTSVVSHSPASGGTGVPLTSNVSAVLSEDVEPGSIQFTLAGPEARRYRGGIPTTHRATPRRSIRATISRP